MNGTRKPGDRQPRQPDCRAFPVSAPVPHYAEARRPSQAFRPRGAGSRDGAGRPRPMAPRARVAYPCAREPTRILSSLLGGRSQGGAAPGDPGAPRRARPPRAGAAVRGGARADPGAGRLPAGARGVRDMPRSAASWTRGRFFSRCWPAAGGSSCRASIARPDAWCSTRCGTSTRSSGPGRGAFPSPSPARCRLAAPERDRLRSRARPGLRPGRRPDRLRSRLLRPAPRIVAGAGAPARGGGVRPPGRPGGAGPSHGPPGRLSW